MRGEYGSSDVFQKGRDLQWLTKWAHHIFLLPLIHFEHVPHVSGWIVHCQKGCEKVVWTKGGGGVGYELVKPDCISGGCNLISSEDEEVLWVKGRFCLEFMFDVDSTIDLG